MSRLYRFDEGQYSVPLAEPMYVLCPDCEGTGAVWQAVKCNCWAFPQDSAGKCTGCNGLGWWQEPLRDCPACNGTGYRPLRGGDSK